MVRAWREIVTIPTYKVGKSEKNPNHVIKLINYGKQHLCRG